MAQIANSMEKFDQLWRADRLWNVSCRHQESNSGPTDQKLAVTSPEHSPIKAAAG